MTNKEDRIKMLMQQRKRGGWTGFWSIREEAAEWGYDLAVPTYTDYCVNCPRKKRNCLSYRSWWGSSAGLTRLLKMTLLALALSLRWKI